jgi:hypothetical protein
MPNPRLPLTSALMTYRIHRFEIRAILFATLLSVAVSAIVITWIETSGYGDCLITGNEPTVTCLGLESTGAWFGRIARMSIVLAAFFPFVAGLLLGTPLVAKEIDSGTARLAWSLSPSRGRWYVARLLPILAAILLAGMAIGIVADVLVGTTSPNRDLAHSFIAFHGRGVLLATSALVIGSTAVALGAILGRPTPTLLLSLVLGGLMLFAVSEIDRKVLLAPEAVVAPQDWNGSDDDLYIDGKFQLPDGTLATWEELVARDPSFGQGEFGPEMPFVQLIIPGERYREVEAREAGIHLGISAILLLVGGMVVLRRRPG